ncbi:MAG: putative maltokinase, partial [Verrucomicrobiota bacterium]|nr:putative maltokinase [Verrucomicrobiota bacterium]
LFRLMSGRQRFAGRHGELIGAPGSSLSAENSIPTSHVLSAEQSNSSILYENKYFLKLYRKLEDGVNPDVEVTRFLTERSSFTHVPAFAGAIEYRRAKAEPTVVCLLQSAIVSEGDAWALTLDSVSRFYERVLARKADLQNQTSTPAPLLKDLIGGVYPERARLLGKRTGEMHLALAADSADRMFAPEPFNTMAQRSVYQNMRASLRRAFALLEKKLPDLPEHFRREASEVLAAEKQILAQQQKLLDRISGAAKIRIHGDYHLGQVLYTGKDFVILDFEGEPARPLSERKLKRSALRDVTGMMRSFQYAAYSALWQPAMRTEDVPFLERWADLWYRSMSAAFLKSYLKATRGASFIPKAAEDLEVMLEAYLLDKAVYEIGYELNNRPDWVVIPIRGIKHIISPA